MWTVVAPVHNGNNPRVESLTFDDYLDVSTGDFERPVFFEGMTFLHNQDQEKCIITESILEVSPSLNFCIKSFFFISIIAIGCQWCITFSLLFDLLVVLPDVPSFDR